MKLTITLLIAVACHASTVDQSQVYQTGNALFHWVDVPDYGYQPLDYTGQIISGITYGAIVWLVDDAPPGPSVQLPPSQEPCCAPVPAPSVPAAVTPEPSGAVQVGLGFVILIIVVYEMGKWAGRIK